MRKLLLIFAIVLGTMSAMAQTGTEVINKYKDNKAVTYFNVDVDASKKSLADVEDSIRIVTAGVFDKECVDKFIAGVKEINSLEVVVVPEKSTELLSRMRNDVSNLTDNGYNVITSVKSLDYRIGRLTVAKCEPSVITEIVTLTPIKDKKVYILCDVKGRINTQP